MTSPTDDQPPPAFSAESAAQLTRFGSALVEALQEYVIVAAAVRGPDDDASTDDAYARVVQAMAVFDAAHLDHLEYPAPAGDVDDLEFEDEDDSQDDTSS